jgi:hypothetical protein
MGWEIGGIPGPDLINLFVRDLNVLDVIGWNKFLEENEMIHTLTMRPKFRIDNIRSRWYH